MKPFHKFLLLASVPLTISLIIGLATGSFSSLSSLRPTVVTIEIFLVIAASHAWVFDRLILSNSLLKSFSLSSAVCATGVFVFGSVLLFLFDGYVKFKIPFSQALISVVFLAISITLAIIFERSARLTVVFFESRLFYAKLIAGTMLAMWSILTVMNLDPLLLHDYPVDYFIDAELKFLRLSAFNAVGVFALLWLLNRIKFLRQYIWLSIFVNPLLLLPLHLVIFQRVLKVDSPSISFMMVMMSALVTMLQIAVLLYRQSKKHQELRVTRLKLNLSQKETEYLQLKNQLNPHFLFNNINTLISFIETEPEKAVSFGHNLSNVHRHYLKNPQEVVPLCEELLFINQYLEIYKAKFASAFDFNVIADPGDDYVLFGAAQELIDNIFKHNELDEDQPLEIRIYRENSNLVVRNTIQLKSAASGGTGLANIRRRYKLLTGLDIAIRNEATYFQVKLPLLSLER